VWVCIHMYLCVCSCVYASVYVYHTLSVMYQSVMYAHEFMWILTCVFFWGFMVVCGGGEVSACAHIICVCHILSFDCMHTPCYRMCSSRGSVHPSSWTQHHTHTNTHTYAYIRGLYTHHHVYIHTHACPCVCVCI